MASEMREASGLPVGRPVSSAEVVVTRALRPKDCLAPLRELFSRAGNRGDCLPLFAGVAQYGSGDSQYLASQRSDCRDFRDLAVQCESADAV